MGAGAALGEAGEAAAPWAAAVGGGPPAGAADSTGEGISVGVAMFMTSVDGTNLANLGPAGLGAAFGGALVGATALCATAAGLGIEALLLELVELAVLIAFKIFS